MELYRRPDSKFWWVQFTVEGQPKPVRKSTKRTNKKEAELVAAAWYREAHDRAQLGVKPELTLAEACQRYLEAKKDAPGLKNKVRNRDKLLGVGHWSGKVFNLRPDMKMSELKTHHVTELRDKRRAEGLANNSVNIEVKFLQAVYNACRKEWGVNVNPDVIFKTMKVFNKTRYLSKEEEAEVLKRLQHKDSIGYRKAYAFAVTLLDTGLRYSEALNLRWSQIETEEGLIRVFRQKTGTWSTVPLTDRAEAALTEFRVQPRPFMSMDRGVKLLRIAIDEVCNVDEYVMKSAGRASIHSLRDTYATRLVQNGMTLFKVSKLLGHSNVKQTSKYSHLETDVLSDEARRILENR